MKSIVLQDGAWLISDAHYAHYRTDLYRFLSSLSPSDLPPQIILMGDIFDLLFGDAKNSIEINLEMVDLLKEISLSCEVVYLEGNHDFGLREIFDERIHVVARRDQPLMAHFDSKSIALHHGDCMQGIGYEIYTAMIRNRWINRLLNTVDTVSGGAIIAWLESYNRSKELCRYIENFEKKMKTRLKKLLVRYDFDIWVEGHYHQNIQFNDRDIGYVNLPAFACDGAFVVACASKEGIDFKQKRINNVIV
ncbi:UDP-2,3-diacylglucosamine diphosphatase [Hydrogenimonas sp.]